jgi:uncharacterized protein
VSYLRINDENKKREYGFIAQELEEALLESGVSNSGIISRDDKGMLSVRYNDLMAPMVKAMQEQQQQIEALKKELAQSKSENVSLKESFESRLQKLEDMVGAKAQK